VMNEHGIVSYSALNHENLRRADYANTLAAEAFRVGLLNEEELESLRMDLMNSLSEIIGLYTRNESSSVKAETARELTASMMYNIDTYLLTFGDHGKALEALRTRKTYELYGKGYLINQKRYENAKILYGKVRLTRLKNASEAYNKTLDKYFHYYLTNYDARFSAHSKIYLTLIEYKISGSFHIDMAIKALNRLLEINRGRQADVMAEAADNSAPASEEE